jgi:hypothetical protein
MLRQRIKRQSQHVLSSGLIEKNGATLHTDEIVSESTIYCVLATAGAAMDIDSPSGSLSQLSSPLSIATPYFSEVFQYNRPIVVTCQSGQFQRNEAKPVTLANRDGQHF